MRDIDRRSIHPKVPSYRVALGDPILVARYWHLADEEVSIGNYVLSGGELAAAIVIDATARLLPGVLGNDSSAAFDSSRTISTSRASNSNRLKTHIDWSGRSNVRGWLTPIC